jgi:hypothetical protein
MAKIIFEFFICIGSHPQGPYLQDFGIEESLGVRFDKMDQGLNQILRLAAAGADKDSVPPMDMAKDLFLGDNLLRVDLLQFLPISILHFQGEAPLRLGQDQDEKREKREKSSRFMKNRERVNPKSAIFTPPRK